MRNRDRIGMSTKEMKVSVIVPVYNAELYLERCVRSLVAQTYTNTEIIVVDDGSEDESLTIAKAWAEKDKRILVLCQCNKGVSAAKNHALRHATGRWVCFVDSDDEVADVYIEQLVADIADLPLVIQAAEKIQLNGSSKYLMKRGDAVIDITDFFSKYIIGTFGFSWAKLFKMDVIKEHALHFEAGVHLAEDTMFLIDYLLCIDKVRISESCNYKYIERENSLVKQMYTYEEELQILRHIADRIECLARKCEVVSMEYRFKEYNYYLFRVLSALGNIASDKIRLELLKPFVSDYKQPLLYMYRDSRLRGKLLSYFLKNGNLRLFNLAIKYLYKK